ncbi:MAG: hypothetical protein Q7U04_12795 [Bacteriovorax sp.]|nr:hypothetical protein [Bacteriovorax sp.]
MKGTIFLKPLEYSIIANGERWRQGDKINGCLRIKNHGSDNIELNVLTFSLALGYFKKIKIKDKKAWEVLAEINLGEKIVIEALEEKEFVWDFVLPEDCQITEKDKSLFLVFKTNEELWATGQLELVIEPKLVINQLLEIFQNFLRFKILQTKFSKGMVEIKLNPPSSRELSHVESFILRVKEVDNILDLEYTFNMLVFETVAGNVMTQKKIKQVQQQLTSKQYYVYGNTLNQDFLIETFSAVIKEATPKFYM